MTAPNTDPTADPTTAPDTALPAPIARAIILLAALAQGCLLYLIWTNRTPWLTHSLSPDTLTTIMVYTLSLPPVLALLLIRLTNKRLWQHLALIVLVQAAMTASALWASSADHTHAGPVWLPLAGGMLLAVFVALPWLQVRQRYGHFRVPYTDLFELAWHNTLCLLLAALFTGIGWALLMLWGLLFNALQVTVFLDICRHPAFALPATCVLFALGVLIARGQPKPVNLLRQVLFALCKGLLPLLALIVVLFVVSLPVTGLAPLWQTRYAAWLLTTVVACAVVLVNAVWQDGRGQNLPYPPALCRLVELGLLALPVCAVLAVTALALRIDQYGWTVGRFFGVLVTLLACGYALGYAAVVLRGWLPRTRTRAAPWLAALGRVNRGLALVAIALAVLANTPVLDAQRIAAISQTARLRADPANMDDDVLNYLRFYNGRRGVAALRALRDEPLMAATPVSHPAQYAGGAEQTAQARIDRVLALDRWGRIATDDRITDLAALREHLVIAPDSDPPDDWWQRVLQDKLNPTECRRTSSTCVVRRVELNPDTQHLLLCSLYRTTQATCLIHGLERDETGNPVWRTQGRVSLSAPDLKTALQHAPLTTLPPRWPMLQLDAGEPAEIRDAEPWERD